MFAPLGVFGQFTYGIDQSIPVQDENGDPLAMPWAGGLNAAQYNTMDLDGDTVEDLVLYDRMANKPITFLRVDDHYVYAPEYETQFPSKLSNWLLLRDFNCDGLKDIFTGHPLGIRVFTNTTTGSTLSWEHYLFYNGPGNRKDTVILTKGFQNKINLQLQYDDLPSITDADGDGDLDIFNVKFTGAGTIEFHKNFSQERHGSCDSLDFERITQKWGGVTECNCDDFAFNNETCDDSGGRTLHAAGKSLLMLDATGDGNLDAILSEATCTHLSVLPNAGTTESPVINTSAHFPSATPANFLIFPAAYFEDVDFDGVKDLIASPNIYGKTFFGTNLQSSNWFYKNTGTNEQPVFTFSRSNFLQEHMIDVGDNAVPAFADFDNDGDYDLFISQHSTTATVATIYQFENVGTTASPAFRLVSDNYMNFRSASLYNLKIQFVHMNNDGRPDLAFTATSFQDGSTRLYYIPNQGSNIFQFRLDDAQVLPIDLLSTENVCITQVNADGLPDLLVGRNTGALEYWINQGPPGTLNFSLADESFLGISSSVLRQNVSAGVADLNADGNPDLMLGDQTGKLRIVSDFRRAEDVANILEDLVFNPITAWYEKRNLGGRIWPVAVNLYNTDKPVIAVGNILGGITLLRHDEGAALPENAEISIYPNPASRSETVNVKLNKPAHAKILSVTGQELTGWITLRAHEPNMLPVRQFSLSPGIYILYCAIQGKTIAKRFVIY